MGLRREASEEQHGDVVGLPATRADAFRYCRVSFDNGKGDHLDVAQQLRYENNGILDPRAGWAAVLTKP